LTRKARVRTIRLKLDAAQKLADQINSEGWAVVKASLVQLRAPYYVVQVTYKPGTPAAKTLHITKLAQWEEIRAMWKLLFTEAKGA
jgi:hypothetical protein